MELVPFDRGVPTGELAGRQDNQNLKQQNGADMGNGPLYSIVKPSKQRLFDLHQEIIVHSKVAITVAEAVLVQNTNITPTTKAWEINGHNRIAALIF